MATYSINFQSVSIPTGSGGAALILGEDVDGDGEVENADTVSLTDGTTSYTTADVFQLSGSVRASFDYQENTDVTVAESISGPVEVLTEVVETDNAVISTSSANTLLSSDSGEQLITEDEITITDLTITDASTEDELSLGWSDPGGVSGYYVYRAEQSTNVVDEYTQIANITNTNYTDTNLEDGEKYYYRVEAYE